MIKKYKTVGGPAEAEIIEKKSRFIAAVKPVSDETEARAFIDLRRKAHPDASHNVYAYQIGEKNEVQRMSDDGEPGGTAGMPVLEILRSGDIKNAVIVVTRYFGGVLLGAGGLSRAYGKAARQCIIAAGVAELTLHRELCLTLDYGIEKKAARMLAQNGCVIIETTYTDLVAIRFLTADCDTDARIKDIADLSNGKAKIELAGYCYK